MANFLSIAVLCFCLLHTVAVAQETLRVSVYFESLCPDSIRFITTQLFPTFQQVGGHGNKYFNIDFVPYGKATTTEDGNGGFTFSCQHGLRECEGNKMQTCALKYLPPTVAEAFINCSMSSSDPPSAGPSCASLLGVDFAPVESCFNSLEGSQLLAANGNRTHSLDPVLTYVPWITYNGVFSASDLTESQENFFALLCQKLGPNGPNGCPDQSTQAAANLTVAVFYETLCPDSIRFITRQLVPAFVSFGGFSNQYFDIDFVPYGKAEGPNGTFTFECQHGARECEGNKMHACALKNLPEESRAAFINCSMASGNPPAAGPACAESLGLDFLEVETCIETEGDALLAANGERTHSLDPELYYVPWILFNEVFSETDLDNAQTNLVNLLCEKLQPDNAPELCSSKSII